MPVDEAKRIPLGMHFAFPEGCLVPALQRLSSARILFLVESV